MNQEQKDIFLESAREHVRDIREDIQQSLIDTRADVIKGKEDFKTLSPSDQVTQMVLLKYAEKREEELSHLYPSPYFVRCDILMEGERTVRSIYFAKFPFSECEIYSWTAPVATIRFEPMGRVTYTLPDGASQSGELLRRDQYMIVDGKIVFLAAESLDTPRELVYQEHFSSRKQGFVLPEIVAQMEKAQDQVIRAHHVGPFVISGPAGSGKTTLALHRVAYLVQSPDTAQLYPARSILVLVQDIGTKQYFSKLLPELGIHDVEITTFAEWAFAILSLKGVKYVGHYGETEAERDVYEYAKLEALRSMNVPGDNRRPFDFLESMYLEFFDAEQSKLWNKQKKDKVLDRTDLTLLLLADRERYGNLGTVREYYVEQKNGKLKKKVGRMPWEYSLAVVDEFQNYLPEQLILLKACVKSSLRSMVYVGDMAQQIRFGTVRHWEDIEESISEERSVKLHKVYRNTKHILRYIQDLGYDVEIPEGMREGVPVKECLFEDIIGQVECVKGIVKKYPEASVGILAKSAESLRLFQVVFAGNERVHMLTMEESQGVEFDIVCIVGIEREAWQVDEINVSQSFADEKKKILRDLLYIALTRAVSQLHVLGRCSLKEGVK